ncbi:MAG: hypothetical protein NVSMB52_01010 [Chloroflexota bacterium]
MLRSGSSPGDLNVVLTGKFHSDTLARVLHGIGGERKPASRRSMDPAHSHPIFFFLAFLFVVVINPRVSNQFKGNAVQAINPSDSKPKQGFAPTMMDIEPDDGSRHLIRALDRARSAIFVEMYILTDHRVIRALQRASAQGVRVYVMLERHPYGMGLQPEHLADELLASEIMVRWSPPQYLLTHAKTVVIDDRIGIISSANFSRSAFSRNRDLLIFLTRGMEVRDLSALFRADWDRLSVTMTDPNLIISPDDSRAKITSLIRCARHTLSIYAEEVGDVRTESLLVREAATGVHVRLILAWGQTPSAARYLTRGGVRVRQLRKPYIHAKMLLVDAALAFVGSENLSTQSLDRNREVGALIRGSQLTRLSHVFDKDWKLAQPFH